MAMLLTASHVSSAFLAGGRTHGNARTAVRMSVSGTVPEGTCSTVVFLRHGQSLWNEANLFTGWADVELTTLGKNEAATGATAIWKEGIVFDVGYTSRLTRAKQTLDIVLQITGQEDLPIHRCWRLNERMYGALTGLNKKETVVKYGEDQVNLWRRSYDTPPPPIELDSEHAPHGQNKVRRYARVWCRGTTTLSAASLMLHRSVAAPLGVLSRSAASHPCSTLTLPSTATSPRRTCRSRSASRIA